MIWVLKPFYFCWKHSIDYLVKWNIFLKSCRMFKIEMHQASVGKCYIPLDTSPLINYTYGCIGSCICVFDPIKADNSKSRVKCLFFEVRNTKWYKWNDTRQTGRSCTGWQGMKTNHSFTCQSGSDLTYIFLDRHTNLP